MMFDEFTKRPEIILISYDGVIKSTEKFVLQQILTKYREHYEDFLDLSKIENLDDKNLERFCIQRMDKNIFRSLAKSEFDFDKTYKEITQKFDDMYLNINLLMVGKILGFIVPQKFTEKIYIHTPEYDKRIHLDIQMNYKNMDKINYITGDLIDVINEIGNITSYLFSDIIDVSALLATDKIKFTTVLVANYGYNYILDNNKLILRMNLQDIMKEYVFKFATFMPIEFTEEHFSSIFK